MRIALMAAVTAMLLFLLPPPLRAQVPGVTKDEIRIGQTMPYSGNASAYGVVGKAMVAYFEKLNREQGGINGRKITLISLDDGYAPPKTESRPVAWSSRMTCCSSSARSALPPILAIHDYLNSKRIPHLFVTSGADKWADPKKFPWTMPGMVSYQTEAAVVWALFACNPSGGEGGAAHAERRLRQGLRGRLSPRAR